MHSVENCRSALLNAVTINHKVLLTFPKNEILVMGYFELPNKTQPVPYAHVYTPAELNVFLHLTKNTSSLSVRPEEAILPASRVQAKVCVLHRQQGRLQKPSLPIRSFCNCAASCN